MPDPILAASKAPANLLTWLQLCSSNQELIRQFDRLNGTNVARQGSPLVLMIDDATGRFEADAKAFFDFCLDLYLRLPRPSSTTPQTSS